jgi:uncharacterized protein (DUF952 family)
MPLLPLFATIQFVRQQQHAIENSHFSQAVLFSGRWLKDIESSVEASKDLFPHLLSPLNLTKTKTHGDVAPESRGKS